MARVSVIGAGFSGLSAACYLAKEGHQVTIHEKNHAIGGRARAFCANGFMFDMGPSWYWMPDIFESFFKDFGKKTTDYYQLHLLDPGFQMIHGANDVMPIPKDVDKLAATFEAIEPGSAEKLRIFLADARFKYEAGMGKMVHKPSFSWLEFAEADVIKSMGRLQMFSPVSTVVRQHFNDPRLRALLEFPVLFLGAMANKIPALYTLMNYAALELGTWYPMGGMIEIVNAMQSLALELGVTIKTNDAVSSISVSENSRVNELQTNSGIFHADAVVASGDYQHIEQELLPEKYRRYTKAYWDSRTFAPSCLIYYLGVNKKIAKLLHHNLFFDADMEQHSNEIYTHPQWPKEPLFYVCCPSKTDASVAPPGMENLFVLVPIAPDLTDNEQLRNSCYAKVMERLEAFCEEPVASNIVYSRSYCANDFKADYNAYKGNAYGLANTLLQTAVLKPSMRNKKVKNLFYAGQLTVPGPGVPPSLISGKLAAEQISKYLNLQRL